MRLTGEFDAFGDGVEDPGQLEVAEHLGELGGDRFGAHRASLPGSVGKTGRCVRRPVGRARGALSYGALSDPIRDRGILRLTVVEREQHTTSTMGPGPARLGRGTSCTTSDV